VRKEVVATATVSPRAQAVIETFRKVINIIEDKDMHEVLEATLMQLDPESVLRAHIEGRTIPKWRVDLFVALTELYDRAHSNALKELEKWK